MVAAASEEASTNVQSVASSTEGDGPRPSPKRSTRVSRNRRGWPMKPSVRARTTNSRVADCRGCSAHRRVVETHPTPSPADQLAGAQRASRRRAGDAGRGFADGVEVKKRSRNELHRRRPAENRPARSPASGGDRDPSGRSARGDPAPRSRSCRKISSTIAAAVEEQGAAAGNFPQRAAGGPGYQRVSANITDVRRSAGGTGTASSRGALLSPVAVVGRWSPQRQQQVPEFGSARLKQPINSARQARPQQGRAFAVRHPRQSQLRKSHVPHAESPPDFLAPAAQAWLKRKLSISTGWRLTGKQSGRHIRFRAMGRTTTASFAPRITACLE